MAKESELFARIADHVAQLRLPVLPPVASKDAVVTAESSLRFDLPAILKRLYCEIADGGFGPSYGILGIEPGPVGGGIVAAHNGLQEGLVYAGRDREFGLLPICDWGCASYSCVDCTDDQGRMWMVNECELSRVYYSIDEFFEMWMDGVLTPNVLYPPSKKKKVQISRPAEW